jgi:hypothetical protein
MDDGSRTGKRLVTVPFEEISTGAFKSTQSDLRLVQSEAVGRSAARSAGSDVVSEEDE